MVHQSFRSLTAHFPTCNYLMLPAMLAALLLCAVLQGCTSKDNFTVNGEIEGLGTQNIRLVYYEGGSLRERVVPVVDSKFELEGTTPDEETIYEIFSSDRNRLGVFAARNGEEISLKLVAGKPGKINIKGNATTAELVNFIGKNYSSGFNDAIAAQARKNPGTVLSDILLAYFYDASANPDEALELLSAVKLPSAVYMVQGKVDMLRAPEPVVPDSLRLRSLDGPVVNYALTDSTRFTFIGFETPPDSAEKIDARFDSINFKHSRAALVRMAADSFGLRTASGLHPAELTHFWAPGLFAEPALQQCKLPSLPYYLVTDTLGVVVYRGDSLPEALSKLP